MKWLLQQKSWNLIKQDLIEATDDNLEKSELAKLRRKWIKKVSLQMMEEWRKVKNISEPRNRGNRENSNAIYKEAKAATENYLNYICPEIEEKIEKCKIDSGYKMVETFLGKQCIKSSAASDSQSNIFNDNGEFVNRWKEYIVCLYIDKI